MVLWPRPGDVPTLSHSGPQRGRRWPGSRLPWCVSVPPGEAEPAWGPRRCVPEASVQSRGPHPTVMSVPSPHLLAGARLGVKFSREGNTPKNEVIKKSFP